MGIPFLNLQKQYQTLKPEIEKEVLAVLESCAYIGGRYVQRFEQELSDYLEKGIHVIGCNSGTDALMLALRACDVKPGDEVITTAFSFFATAEAVAAIGAVPVFVDIRESDFTIDPQKIEEKITKKTKAILPVHIFGAPCQMDEIMAIAKKHKLKVIEDAAQAIGSEYRGRKAGTLGDAACFSFYPTKNLGGCGDGGAVVTANEDIAVAVRALREHGAGKNGARARAILEGSVEEDNISEKASELYDPYKYYNYLIGYNSRLDAVQAAVLSVKLKYLERFNSERSRIAEKYSKGLSDKIIRPVYESEIKTCWHQYVIRCKDKAGLCEFLGSREIGCGTFYPVPLHRQKAFHCDYSLPVSELIASQSVCLPIFPELTDEEAEEVIDSVNLFLENGSNR